MVFSGLGTSDPNKLLLPIAMTPDTTLSSSAISRFLLPSARDLLFVLLFWALLAGPLSNRPLADADIGWHIRNGEQILVSRSIPRTDSFSSIVGGQSWFAWEWLYDVVLGLVHRAMGLNGVVLLAALIIAATFAVLFSQLLGRGVGLPLAIVLWLLVLGASSIHLFARPHIVSWFFSLAWFVALEQWEQGKSPRWLPWFFPGSIVLWVNLHGGWLFGLALLGVYGIAALVESRTMKDPIRQIQAGHRARSMAVGLGLSFVGTVINPYGLRLHRHIYQYLTDRYLMSRIQEFRSPDFHGWAERSFAAILVLVLLAFVARRSRIRVSHLCVVLLASGSGLYASRNLPVASMLLALVSGPILWDWVVSLRDRPGAWRLFEGSAVRVSNLAVRAGRQENDLSGHLWPVLAVIAAFLLSLNAGRLGSRQVIDGHFDSERLPVAAVEFLSQEKTLDPIFSPDAWGGYLIYRLYPQRQVVIDDRHDLYGSARFREYLVLLQGEPEWNRVLSKWRLRTMLLPEDSTLASLLRQLPETWQPVYKDRVAVIFERRER